MATETGTRFYNRHEAAARVGVSVYTLDRARKRGEVGYVKVGAKVMYTDRDLKRFMDKVHHPAVDGWDWDL